MSNKKINEVPGGDETLTNDDILLGMDSPDINGVTKKISVEALSNHVLNISQQNFLSLSSDSYVVCTPEDNVQEKYNEAKALTPKGNPLSHVNRATLIILPGLYEPANFPQVPVPPSFNSTFPTFTADALFVDIIGLGSFAGGISGASASTMLAKGVFGDETAGAGCTCAVIFKDVIINITASDVVVRGISASGGPKAGRYGDGGGTLPWWVSSSPDQIFIECIGGTASFEVRQPIDRISSITLTSGGSGYQSVSGPPIQPRIRISPPDMPGGRTATARLNVNYSSGQITSITLLDPGSGYTAAPTITIDPPTNPGDTATATCLLDDKNNGKYINCMALPGSWWSMGSETECYNCIVQPASITDVTGLYGGAYGLPGFVNLEGGTYINCHGGFINSVIAFNGTYINCSGKFGKFRAEVNGVENPVDTPEVELSGFFKGCIGLFKGIASGHFENCKGLYTNEFSINDVSFAPHIPIELTTSAEDAASFPRQTTTGTFVRCNSSGKFPLVEGQGKMALCIDGDYNVVNAGQSIPE